MIEVKAIEGDGPGQWSHGIGQGEEGPSRRITLRCPQCEKQSGIVDHLIDEEGQVHPSVGCTHCGLHMTVVLVGIRAKLDIPLPPPLPLLDPCATCGRRARFLSGWTMCGRGLLCPKCWADWCAELAKR